MKQSNKYVTGWLKSSVHDFLEQFSFGSTNTEFALITCLDSNSDPTSLLKSSSTIKTSLNGVEALNGGLLFPSRILNDPDVLDDLFFGFDEIWFFPSNKIEPKPKTTSIVGPIRIDNTKLNKLRDWMTKNQCSLGLGDGCGLNFVVQATGIARDIIAHSMSQPELSFRNELCAQNEEEKSPVHIPFERHGKYDVALIALEKLFGKRFLHYSRIPRKEESWALRDYANELILRSGLSPLTSSEIEAGVTHSEKAAYRSVEKKHEWKMDCKEAAEKQFGPKNVDMGICAGAADIGRWCKMSNRAS